MTQYELQRWEDWGNPDAAGVAADELAGHGTGGKAYMWNMFRGDAYLHSVKDGRQNVWGFQSEIPSERIVPGQFGDTDLPVSDVLQSLDEQLTSICGVSVDLLPEDAQRVLRSSRGYTLAVGEDPKDVNRSTIPVSRWLDGLQATGQMIQVLESSKVYVYHNGRLVPDASPISGVELEEVDSRELVIPALLPDPHTGIAVSTGANEQSVLRLRMCNSDLTRSRQGFNRIFYWADGGMRGETPLRGFTASGWGRRIWGEVYLDSLNPTCVSEERLDLVEIPLSRALKEWLRDRIEEYVDEFDQVEARQVLEEDRRRNVEIMEAFNEWENQFLDELFGLGGQGTGTGGSTGRVTRTRLPRGDVARIRVAAEADTAGVDVALPFTVQFFDANEQRVRPVPVDWDISDWNVCGIDEDVSEIRTYAPGAATINVVTNQGIRSNQVQLEVLDLVEIELQEAVVEVQQGERRLLHARCTD